MDLTAQLLAHAPWALAVLDRELRYVFVNQRWVKDFHLPFTPDELRGRAHYDLFPDLPVRWREIHRRGLRGDVERCDAEAFPRADGTVHWLRWETRPWYDERGEIAGIVLMSEDVTAQQRAAEELRRWQHVFEHAAWGMSLASPDNRFLAVNRAFAAMHGGEPAEWAGRSLLDMFDEASKALLPQLAERAAETGHVVYESVHVRADGSTFPCLTHVTAYRDGAGAVQFRAAYFEDITERHRAERALGAERRRLERSVEDAPFGVTIYEGPQHRLAYLNRVSRELGNDRGMVGKTRAELYPEANDESEEILTRVYTTGVPEFVRGIRTPLLRADGTRDERWFDATWQPAYDADGKVSGVMVTGVDVTAYVKAREALSRAVAVRDEFLSIASHELRTPLAVLELQLGSLEEICRRPPDDASWSKVGARVDKSARQVARLTELVESLLDVSRLAGGDLRLQLDEFDLVSLARDVVDRFELPADRARTPIQIDAPAPLRGRWDRTRLDQVLTNLVANAVKYGAGRPIDIRIVQENGRAIVTVRDRGIGIEPADLARIFGRFERAVSSNHYGGLGLGLYIAHQLVTAHGGTIDATSTAGEGATFVVSLPLGPPDAG